ncbi:hypothetical protein GB937_009432, partial [Aspergillus fischeri]
MGCKPLTFVLLPIPLTSAHLAAFTEGIYCPEGSYQGALTNATDPNLHIFDPLYQLSGDDCCVPEDAYPTTYSVTNPAVIAAGLVTSSHGLAKPNLHCANKSTAAGTALAAAYKSSIWEVAMEDFVGNMDQTPHKCKIINPNGGQKPKVPSLPPGPGVQGPKQLIAFFQAEGNNIAALPGNGPPTYSTDMVSH